MSKGQRLMLVRLKTILWDCPSPLSARAISVKRGSPIPIPLKLYTLLCVRPSILKFFYGRRTEILGQEIG